MALTVENKQQLPRQCALVGLPTVRVSIGPLPSFQREGFPPRDTSHRTLDNAGLRQRLNVVLMMVTAAV